MLNYIWAGMIIIGIVYGAVTGNLLGVSEGILDSASEAVSLCFTMLGIMAFWVGLMEIAKEAGLITKWQKGISPILKFLFPRLDLEGEASGYIATNMIANLLGLGWACTPAGLKAMEALARVEKKRLGVDKLEKASTEMCTFLIVNISSLQLIPINMIAYRSQYGSVYPSAIIVPAILATACSTLAGVFFAKVAGGISERRGD
ncbi:MAG: nucleoside recognition protein [Lachnospiraceae bacterium]